MSKWTLLIIAIASSLALYSLFANEFFIKIHDQVQPERVVEMSTAIKAGQIPPRYVDNLGYGFGYPLFNYYAPFPYYLGALLYMSGLSLISSTKIMIAIGFIGAGISMYLCARSIWNKQGATLAAMLYLLAPYHAVQLYVRGSIGELFAYALIPCIVLGIIELLREKSDKKWVILGSSAIALLSISHTISLYMVLYCLAFFAVGKGVFHIAKKQNPLHWMKKISLYVGVPLLVTTYFWGPAILELDLISFSTASGNNVNFEDHFITSMQLWSSAWGYGGSAPGIAADGMSFMLGKISILLVITGSILLAIKHKTIAHSKPLIILLAMGMFAAIHMLEISQVIWESVPYFNLIQFPWRFLVIVNGITALIAPLPLVYFSQKLNTGRQYFIPFFIGITIIYSLFSLNKNQFFQTKYFVAQGYQQKTEKELISKEHLRTAASYISDEYLPTLASKPLFAGDISKDKVQCTSECVLSELNIVPGDYSFTVSAQESGTVYIDKVYFPVFRVEVNNQLKKIDTAVVNKMGVGYEKGENRVSFMLKDTPVRALSNLVSTITLFCLSLYWYQIQYKNRKKRTKV